MAKVKKVVPLLSARREFNTAIVGAIVICYEKKQEAVKKYKRGERSQDSIAREYGVNKSSFQLWLANDEAVGSSSLTAW